MDDADELSPRLVRPYFLTQGRTEAALAIETMVVANPAVESNFLSAEQHDIVSLCREAKAIAEISAILKLPLGVTLVLVSDLVNDGLLNAAAAATPAAFDDNFFDRLITGVERSLAARKG